MARRITEDEVKQISLRMKSARMLTGLTQESFADANCIPLMSLKCWEMGRAVPRREGMLSYLGAIKKYGIEVNYDWVFQGSGPGPTYINGTQIDKPKGEVSYLDQQVELFKKNQLSKGLNPVVVEISDDEMLPLYKPGDLVGGYYVAVEDIKPGLLSDGISEAAWLIILPEQELAPRFLALIEGEAEVFFKSNKRPLLRRYTNTLMAQICWHYKSASTI